jgi:hypothetical protein
VAHGVEDGSEVVHARVPAFGQHPVQTLAGHVGQ